MEEGKSDCEEGWPKYLCVECRVEESCTGFQKLLTLTEYQWSNS